MKVTTPFSSSAFALLFGYAIFGSVGVAQAQSICSCPAGATNLGGGHCQALTCPAGFTLQDGLCTAPGHDPVQPTVSTFNAACHSATPNIGQIAASQQQLSFSTVAGVLRTRRDQLQGPLGSQSSPPSPLMGYSAFNLDDSYRLLGYASDKNAAYGADRNALYKAPAAPAVAAGPTWAAWVEGLGDWEKRRPLNANDIGRTQSTYGVHAGLDATWKSVLLP